MVETSVDTAVLLCVVAVDVSVTMAATDVYIAVLVCVDAVVDGPAVVSVDVVDITALV